jgi:hypothetical protein
MCEEPVYGLGDPRVGVKTPALRALDLIFDQVRALRPGTQGERFYRYLDAFPETETPTCKVGVSVIRDLPPAVLKSAAKPRPRGYQLNGSEH